MSLQCISSDQHLLHQHPDLHVHLFLHPPQAVLVRVPGHLLHPHHLTKLVAVVLVLHIHPVRHALLSAHAAMKVQIFLPPPHPAPHVIGLLLQAPTQARHHHQHLQQT